MMTTTTMRKIEEIVKGFELRTCIERCEKIDTEFGSKFKNAEIGKHLRITIWREPDEDLGTTIYRQFIIGPERELYRFNASDGETAYFKTGGFGGFTAREKLLIMNLMNHVEEV